MTKYKSFFAFLFSVLFVAFIIFFVMSIYFGNNPLNNTMLSKIKIVSILPEGWAFFTAKSTEPRVYAFKLRDNKLTEMNLRNFSGEYYFGMSRYNRVLNLQIANVFQNVPNDSSSHYEFSAVNSIELLSKMNTDLFNFNDISIKKTRAPDLIGKYVIVVQLMLPWSMIYSKPNYPSKYIAYPINIVPYE
jgi:antimicrobial peptide system SdpA family protein